MLISLIASSLRGGLMALGLVSIPVFAGLLVDADPDWKEGEVEMPAPPQAAAGQTVLSRKRSSRTAFVGSGCREPAAVWPPTVT